jgi:hypothetical protein
MGRTPILDHHLVLLPVRTLTEEQATEAVARLEAAGALEVLHAARIRRQADGGLPEVDVVRPGSPPLHGAGWQWLLEAVIRVGLPSLGPPLVGGVSTSFAAEVRAVLGSAERCSATITARIEPGAAVDELAAFPETRLVYGVLPDPALARARQVPGTNGRRGPRSSPELTPR